MKGAIDWNNRQRNESGQKKKKVVEEEGEVGARDQTEEKREGEGQRLSVGDPGMLILFVCLPAMIKLF